MQLHSDSFDVVIATYNRPQSVVSLVNQINACLVKPVKIIIVDSSDDNNEEVQTMSSVIYVRSSHKNQPYQRLLGAKFSMSKYIVYLDDDVEIINKEIFNDLLNEYNKNEVVGVTVGIEYHNSISAQIDKALFSGKSKISKHLWKFTGVPFPSMGKIDRFGVTGPKPTVTSKIESFNGPIMSFKRDLIDSIIDFDLIAMHERRLSIPEDKVISCKANKYGKLMIIPRIYLVHAAIESSYFTDVYTFYRKSTYSRLFINRVVCTTFNKRRYPANIDFYWFSFWRLLIALISLLLNYTKLKREKFRGILSGIALTLTLPQKAKYLTPGIDWAKEIQNDCEQPNIQVQEWEI